MTSEYYLKLLAGDLATFIGQTLLTTNPGAAYLPNWHIRLIADYLEAARCGEINRLIINVPPRALKSTCVSVAWPAWLLGHDPRSRIMAASYAHSLAIKHSIDCRAVMMSGWYRQLFPQVILTRDQNEKHKFMTTQRGFRLATSVGASAIGEGGNFLIIDDPQSPAQAMCTHGRQLANQWFDHNFATRLDDKNRGVMVLVMQRLHEHDLTGHLLSKGGWTHVNLPAVAPETISYHVRGASYTRQQGTLLHPERENELLLERAKIELGSHAFAAQYQQQPLPEEGAMIRPWWLKRYEQTPNVYERCVQSWDTGIKAGQEHDASACLTFLEKDNVSYLCDVVRVRLEYPELKRLVIAQAQRWKPDVILIEDKASGQQLLQDLKRETALPIIAMNPKGNKITRFAAVSALIEAGRVFLPKEALWLMEFEAELLSFPGGKNDDQVDAFTQYLDWLRSKNQEKLRVRRL